MINSNDYNRYNAGSRDLSSRRRYKNIRDDSFTNNKNKKNYKRSTSGT